MHFAGLVAGGDRLEEDLRIAPAGFVFEAAFIGKRFGRGLDKAALSAEDS